MVLHFWTRGSETVRIKETEIKWKRNVLNCLNCFLCASVLSWSCPSTNSNIIWGTLPPPTVSICTVRPRNIPTILKHVFSYKISTCCVFSSTQPDEWKWLSHYKCIHIHCDSDINVDRPPGRQRQSVGLGAEVDLLNQQSSSQSLWDSTRVVEWCGAVRSSINRDHL